MLAEWKHVSDFEQFLDEIDFSSQVGAKIFKGLFI